MTANCIQASLVVLEMVRDGFLIFTVFLFATVSTIRFLKTWEIYFVNAMITTLKLDNLASFCHTTVPLYDKVLLNCLGHIKQLPWDPPPPGFCVPCAWKLQLAPKTLLNILLQWVPLDLHLLYAMWLLQPFNIKHKNFLDCHMKIR